MVHASMTLPTAETARSALLRPAVSPEYEWRMRVEASLMEKNSPASPSVQESPNPAQLYIKKSIHHSQSQYGTLIETDRPKNAFPVHPIVAFRRRLSPSRSFGIQTTKHSSMPRRRSLRRLVLPTRASISGLRRLQLNIVVPSSVGRSVIIRRRRVVAVVVVRLLGLRLRVVRLLRLLAGRRVVGRGAVAGGSAAEGPACAAVGLETALAAAAGGYASEGGCVSWGCFGARCCGCDGEGWLVGGRLELTRRGRRRRGCLG